MTFNLHGVKSVKVLPPDTNNGTVWQSIVVEFEGGKFQLTLFPDKPGNLPFIEPTKPE